MLSTLSIIEPCVPRQKRYPQALEQIFRVGTFSLKTSTLSVKTGQRSLAVEIRISEVPDVDFQRQREYLRPQYGFLEFTDPWSNQAAFESEDHRVIRNGSNSQHALGLACVVPNCGGCKLLKLDSLEDQELKVSTCPCHH